MFTETLDKLKNDNVSIHSATLSYYSILGLPGILVIFLVTTDCFLQWSGNLNQILNLIDQILEPNVTYFLSQIITNINLNLVKSPSVAFTFIILAYSSVNALQQIVSTLNHVWGFDTLPSTSNSHTIDNFIKLLMLFMGGVIFILTIVINSFLNHLIISLKFYVSIFSIDIFISFIILFILFNILYMKLPSKDIPIKNTWKGSLLSSILFMLTQLGISIYFSHFNIGFIYGSASVIVILLLWLYFISLIFYVGSTFNFILSKQ